MAKFTDSAWKLKDMQDGEFKRQNAQFRKWIKADGSGDFLPGKGRYHLYVSLACPWAHRTLIMRKLKGLEDVISVNVVHHHLTESGWHFDEKSPGCTADTECGHSFLRSIYLASNPDYSGKVSVPVLFDKESKTIVSNESSEIIRMFNSEFGDFGAAAGEHKDFYPPERRHEIDELNGWIYDDINNGVYKSGFALTQEAYEKNVKQLFTSLDRVEGILSKNRYLLGSCLTEADIRLYTTLVRFDSVYVGHFKCNVRRIVDYHNIWNYLKELYQMYGFGDTTNMEHIKKHYYVSHGSINPTHVVPIGPEIDFKEEHDRGKLGNLHTYSFKPT